MLTHHTEATSAPERVVVLGSSGFLGARLLQNLGDSDTVVVAISSKDLDLSAAGAGDALAEKLQPGDSLVIFSALTPDRGRDIATLTANLAMINAVTAALQQTMADHVIYISSDAVYDLDQTTVDETTCADPKDLYGVMHKTREVMLASAVPDDRLAILRPTLVYGQGDPHNSYGPNRLRRMARDEGKIRLFGKGEETRDHIFVDDVVALVQEVLQLKSSGMLNLATGKSVSYDELARSIAALFDGSVEVIHSERANPVTHRQFDIAALNKAFPSFNFTSLQDGLRVAHEQMTAQAE